MSRYLNPLALSWLEAWHVSDQKLFRIRIANSKVGDMSAKIHTSRPTTNLLVGKEVSFRNDFRPRASKILVLFLAAPEEALKDELGKK